MGRPIDGSAHDQQVEYNQARTEALQAAVYRFMRCTNEQIAQHLDAVIVDHRQALTHLDRNDRFPLPAAAGAGAGSEGHAVAHNDRSPSPAAAGAGVGGVRASSALHSKRLFQRETTSYHDDSARADHPAGSLRAARACARADPYPYQHARARAYARARANQRGD